MSYVCGMERPDPIGFWIIKLQQGQIVGEISALFATISEVNELTVDGMEQIASTSDVLKDMSANLDNIIQQFRDND